MTMQTQNHSSQQELIEACKRHERKSQRRLYDRYYDMMYASAFRILQDRVDTLDVLQESFIKVFEKIVQYRGQSDLGAWIRRIVINQSLMHLRHAKKLHWEELKPIHESADEVESNALAQYSAADLQRDLAHLPEGARSVFSLYLIEDFSHQEVANLLDISVSTSKSQLHRAKQLLKSLIKNRRYGSI